MTFLKKTTQRVVEKYGKRKYYFLIKVSVEIMAVDRKGMEVSF